MSVSSGIVTTYSATLIRNLNYSPGQAALMNMPSGVVSIFFILLVGYGIKKQPNRFLWIAICIIPAYVILLTISSVTPNQLTNTSITGGALMSFLPIGNRSGILAGIYLVNAVVAPLSIFYSVSTLP